MPSGLTPRRKGIGYEREVVRWLRALGCDAVRVPLSGSAPGYAGDVRVRIGRLSFTAECKRRKSLSFERWMTTSVMFARSDRSETFVIMSSVAFEELVMEVLRAAGRGGDSGGGVPGAADDQGSNSGEAG